jgi:hypothetical protein
MNYNIVAVVYLPEIDLAGIIQVVIIHQAVRDLPV